MKFSIYVLAIGALGFGLAACGGGNSVNTVPVPPARENTSKSNCSHGLP